MTDRTAHYCNYCHTYHPVVSMVEHCKTKEGNQ